MTAAATGKPAMVGGRLRQLREERRLSQAALARELEISPSYLNQIEHNSRPLTVPVLLRITEVFGVDASFFAGHDTSRLAAELGEVMIDAEIGTRVSAAEIADLATGQPEMARAMVALHRRYRAARDQLAQLGDDGVGGLMPHEEARDFFYSRSNYIHALDAPAEKLAAAIEPRRPDPSRAIALYLRDEHGVRVVERDGQQLGALHRFDRDTRVLAVSSHLRPNQRAFKLAGQLAFIEFGDVLAAVADEAGLPEGETRSLVVIGLANYFAAALLLPYGPFLAAAEEYRYDVERLVARFDASFETVCHRLSTLQRPRARGVPFSLVRVDRAGNVSKMLSSTPFHFSRSGGTCPLWNVYSAFAAPSKILTQVASMPDGRHYLWIARTVSRSPGQWGVPDKTFAVGLGCELRHAGRLVYSAGLDLDDRAAATPIGMGCKTCERTACAQRAFPPLGRALAIDRDRSTFVPYPVAARVV